MKRAIVSILIVGVSMLFCLPVPAIVVSNYAIAVNSPTNEVSGTWDLNWDYVYSYKGGSAVAVGSNWLLTAAHLANDPNLSTVNVNGTNYYQQQIIFHEAADDPNHTQKTDLALVRFDKPFPGYYPLYTGSFPASEQIGRGPSSYLQDYPCVMVGYGVTGTVYSTYYTVVAYNDPSSGVKRWGTQRIEDDFTLTYTVRDDPLGTLTNVVGFYMDFDLGNTEYEAGVGVYDSGGGTFVKEGGVWKLAGINTLTYWFRDTTPKDGQSYDWIFSVSMPAYGTWMNNIIAAEDGDDDSDGIPNWWEEQYGSTTGVDASADQDGDGVIGEEEYIADTDPTDSNSFWQVDGMFTLTNQTFTFIGSTARQYQVSYTTSELADPGLIWVTNGSPIWGTGAETKITITNQLNRTIICRIQVTLP